MRRVSSRKLGVRGPAGRRGTDPSASTEDYLAAIYDLGGTGRPVIGARLARHMRVSPPTVTETLQRLARVGYLRVAPGKEIQLTRRGQELAEGMARRHALYKMVSLVQGTNIVRKEQGIKEAECIAADPRLTLFDVKK